MTIRFHAVAVLIASLSVAANVAQAQPVAPVRPTYSSYSSIIRPSVGGAYFGFGFNQTDNSALVQNALIMQQLQQTALSLNGLHTTVTGVDPNLGITGRGAVYNSLGHWYPSARNGGGVGVVGSGGLPPARPVIGSGLLRNTGAMPGGLGGVGYPAYGPFGGAPQSGGKKP